MDHVYHRGSDAPWKLVPRTVNRCQLPAVRGRKTMQLTYSPEPGETKKEAENEAEKAEKSCLTASMSIRFSIH